MAQSSEVLRIGKSDWVVLAAGFGLALSALLLWPRVAAAQSPWDCDYYRDGTCCHCAYVEDPYPHWYCTTGAIIGVTKCYTYGSAGPGICEGECVGG